MTKKKHPHSRAERLALKELHEKQETIRASVRRIKESLKEKEAAEELKNVFR